MGDYGGRLTAGTGVISIVKPSPLSKFFVITAPAILVGVCHCRLSADGFGWAMFGT